MGLYRKVGFWWSLNGRKRESGLSGMGKEK
jgi:hypothetical protein